MKLNHRTMPRFTFMLAALLGMGAAAPADSLMLGRIPGAPRPAEVAAAATSVGRAPAHWLRALYSHSRLRCAALAVAPSLGYRLPSDSLPQQDDAEQDSAASDDDARAARQQSETRENDSPPEPVIAPSQALGYSGPFLLRDGAAVAGAAGRLVRHEAGYWEFVAEPDDPAREPARFIVLPSGTLSRMMRALESFGPETNFEVTGTVYVYDEVNYLLPLSAPRVAAALPDDETATEPVQPEDPAPPQPRDPAQMTAEEIIRDIERSVPAARSLVVDEPEGSGETTGDDEDSLGIDDGAILMSRRGRVTRTAEGGWRFAFAADAAGLSDPPMTLLPCLLLESIRDRIQSGGDDQVFLITGQVFSYRGQRFLLPTMFRMEDVDRNPNIRR